MATLSQEGFNLLKGFEGFRNKPYHLKGEKYYTVGLGHYGPDVDPNKTYTDAECMAFFEKDKQRFEADVNKVWHEPMTQQMFDALFSIAYNHGNVSRTVLANACKGTNYQDQEKMTAIWKNLYTCKGLLNKRRAKEVAYFYGNADTGTPYSGNLSSGPSDYSAANTSPQSSYVDTKPQSGGYAAGSQPNNYKTYDSVYSGAELNTNITASLKMEGADTSTVTHTRIYKSSDPTVLVDELCMAIDEGEIKDNSTGTVNA